MSQRAFHKITAGLTDAIAIARGEKKPAKLHAHPRRLRPSLTRKVTRPIVITAMVTPATAQAVPPWGHIVVNAPVLTISYDEMQPLGFSELDGVRLVNPVETDDGETVPAGTEGTVVGVWADGLAYEVEFSAGVATVEAVNLRAA